jgi:hypothetical protein
MGASRTRHSLRPPFPEGEPTVHGSGAVSAARILPHVVSIDLTIRQTVSDVSEWVSAMSPG